MPEVILFAPCDGIFMALEQVPDEGFASAALGPGLALEPLGELLVAPCAGRVSMVARTGHALTIGLGGAELLIHLGLDTVQLHGQGLQPLVKAGQEVTPGQPILRFDADLLARQARSLITPLVLVAGEIQSVEAMPYGLIGQGQPIAKVRYAQARQAVPETLSEGAETSLRVALESGLHARPAARLKAIGERHSSRLSLEHRNQWAQVERLSDLLALGIDHGSQVRLRAAGGAAQDALREAARLLTTAEGGEAPQTVPPTPPVAEQPPLQPGQVRGIVASPGVAIAPLAVFRPTQVSIRRQARGVEQERARFFAALQQLQERLATQRDGAKQEQDAHILDAHLAWLADPGLSEPTLAAIEQGLSAGSAWEQTLEARYQQLQGADSAVIRARALDLRDLEQRLLAFLEGQNSQWHIAPHSIVLAEELTPSQLMQLDAFHPAGLCLSGGGTTSHVAILARARALPCIVGAGEALLQAATGAGPQAVLDADRGLLETRPQPAQVAAAQERLGALRQARQNARSRAFEAALTQDGVRIEVAANIEKGSQASDAFSMGADGIGLFRSKFLFLDRAQAPDRETQRASYQAALDAAGDKPVIVRALDIGADKQLDYLPLAMAANPALGLRGARLVNGHRELLAEQFRALLDCRPAANAPALGIMLPMVTDVADVRALKALLDELIEEQGLRDEPGFRRPRLGVMIEVPAAALCAEQLAREVDFFSIGTNDLTQYTLAMDREEHALVARIDALHPAVLRLVSLCVKGAARHGRWVGVCGAAAGDELAAAALVALGVDELSMEAPRVPTIKALLRRLDLARLAADMPQALTLNDAAEVRAWLARQLGKQSK